MPHRTKHEAQLRMAIGVARVGALQGLDARSGLEAVRQYLADVKTLDDQLPTPSEAPPPAACSQRAK